MAKLKVKENNTATIECYVKTGKGENENITGWTFQFIVKDSDGNTVFNKVSPTEIVIIDAATGKVNVLLVASDTNNKAGQYKFEFKGTTGTGDTFTLSQGEFIIAETLI